MDQIIQIWMYLVLCGLISFTLWSLFQIQVKDIPAGGRMFTCSIVLAGTLQMPADIKRCRNRRTHPTNCSWSICSASDIYTWWLGTWFTVGLGSMRLTVELDALKGLFHSKWFHDSKRFWIQILLLNWPSACKMCISKCYNFTYMTWFQVDCGNSEAWLMKFCNSCLQLLWKELSVPTFL